MRPILAMQGRLVRAVYRRQGSRGWFSATKGFAILGLLCELITRKNMQ